MRKQVSILFGLLILVFTFSGCFNNQQKEELVVDENQQTQDEEVVEIDIDKDLEKFDELDKKDIFDIKECDQIEDEWTKERCMNEGYLRNAINDNNISLCEKITQESEKNNCIIEVEDFNNEDIKVDLPVSEDAAN